MKQTKWKIGITLSWWGLLIGLAMWTGGCSATQKAGGQLDYSESARILFSSGMRSFERERWTEAEKKFQEVKRQYPYSSHAPLAALRIADCHFNLGSHAEAAVGYAHFIKSYPTHDDAHYASFRIGESYYEQMPGDWLLLPPSHERDQTATREARIAMGRFLKNYPDSPHQPRGRELYTEVVNALVRHEMYVARFYLRKGKKKAAVLRLDTIGQQFPDSELVPDAMFLRAVTFLEIDEVADAKREFEAIIRLFPQHPQAERASAYLDSLSS